MQLKCFALYFRGHAIKNKRKDRYVKEKVEPVRNINTFLSTEQFNNLRPIFANRVRYILKGANRLVSRTFKYINKRTTKKFTNNSESCKIETSNY